MATNFIDPFDSPIGGQTGNTSMPSAALTTVFPTPTNRILFNNPNDNNTININVTPGIFRCDIITGPTANIYYIYNPTPQNLSSVVSITLSGIISSTNATYSLEITSGPITYTVPFNIGPPTSSITWNMAQYVANGVNLSSVGVIRLIITPLSLPFTMTATNFQGELICLSADTKILMADNSIKEIKDLEKGDFVAGNKENTTCYQIARKIHNKVSRNHLVDIVKIQNNALGENYPEYDTIITAWHPILYKNERRPAKCFRKFKGVEYSKKRKLAETILPADESESEEKTYSLYNLQFDTEGFFIANGLVVQSVSPHSALVPLAEEDYYDKSKFDKPYVKESYHQEYPWINEVIEPDY
jgi:hypothetical protein